MPTKGNPTVTVRLKPWMLKALDHLSAREVCDRASDNELGTGPRSEIRHAVLLYLLSQADAGRLPQCYQEMLDAQAEVDRLYARWAELEAKLG